MAVTKIGNVEISTKVVVWESSNKAVATIAVKAPDGEKVFAVEIEPYYRYDDRGGKEAPAIRVVES